MDTTTKVQILDDAVYIAHSANNLGKGINPTFLPAAMGSSADSAL